LIIDRLLKNGHLLRFPHPSSLRRTAKYASLLRISPACAKPLRRRQGGPRRGGISQSSTCICLPAEAEAQAGPFLSNLEKTTFSAAYSQVRAPDDMDFRMDDIRKSGDQHKAIFI
jgi:hypothetical protein